MVAFVLYRILPSTAMQIMAMGNPGHWPHQHIYQSRCSCGIPNMSHSRPQSVIHGIPNTSSGYIHTSKLNTAQTFASRVDIMFMLIMLLLNYTKRAPTNDPCCLRFGVTEVMAFRFFGDVSSNFFVYTNTYNCIWYAPSHCTI